MTDAELIARLRDAPADGLGTENLCLAASDRIEQLKHRLFQCATDLQIYMDAFAVSEAKLTLMTTERDEAWKRAAHAEKMWGEAEVKLAKAVEALQWCAMYGDGDVALATLAEIQSG